MKTIKATEFDKKFDNGEDISGYIDWSKARRVNKAIKRVNVDFPVWMINVLDREASRIGVTRQSVIKTWIAEKATSTNQ
jgi:hypothetical protein